MEARVAEGVREILGPLRNQRLCALDTVVPSLAHSLASALARTELMLVEAGRYAHMNFPSCALDHTQGRSRRE
jgi:hypothetical protein